MNADSVGVRVVKLIRIIFVHQGCRWTKARDSIEMRSDGRVCQKKDTQHWTRKVPTPIREIRRLGTNEKK